MTSMDTISITQVIIILVRRYLVGRFVLYFDVLQVSLVSRNSEIGSLQSSSGGCSVARGELSSISLKSVIKGKMRNLSKIAKSKFVVLTESLSSCDNKCYGIVPTSSKQGMDGGNLHFSSMTTKVTKGHPIQAPPFIDFLKDRFEYGPRKEPPVLQGKEIHPPPPPS